MRFLIDMNLSPGWVDYLTRAGHQAQHRSAIGPGDSWPGFTVLEVMLSAVTPG
jgi:predicted nuclease of predicted toxin-antitoxin system